MSLGISEKIRGQKVLGSIQVRNIDGELLRLEKIYQKKSLRRFTLSSTKNTLGVCRICFGTGNILNQNNFNFIETKCPHCQGSREMKLF